jgi:hypothetical protein
LAGLSLALALALDAVSRREVRSSSTTLESPPKIQNVIRETRQQARESYLTLQAGAVALLGWSDAPMLGGLVRGAWALPFRTEIGAGVMATVPTSVRLDPTRMDLQLWGVELLVCHPLLGDDLLLYWCAVPNVGGVRGRAAQFAEGTPVRGGVSGTHGSLHTGPVVSWNPYRPIELQLGASAAWTFRRPVLEIEDSAGTVVSATRPVSVGGRVEASIRWLFR